ncbi:aldose 1-epimerase family protein [Rhodoferax fermentans]|nr:aldose 1-epimerase family protein [Rhodoferax fermentans]
MMQNISIELKKSFFTASEQEVFSAGDMSVSLFRYDSGVEALRLKNNRGHLIVLPFMGQMVWEAVFDGVSLGMKSMFKQPRPATDILQTYGCFAYHSGLLRNGCPSPEDTHALHGEMPCAPMDRAHILCGEDQGGFYVALVSEWEYAMGFGNHYLATPRIVLRPNESLFDLEMKVQNLSGAPMDLMYISHVNFGLVKDGKIFQAADFSPSDTCVRTSIPGHIQPTPVYQALIDELAKHPDRSEVLHDVAQYNPEQVFFIRHLKSDPNGLTHMMVRRPEQDGFYMSWSPKDMPKTIRWILCNSDQEVGAFALPGSCEPEGYLAEKAKGNVRSLAGGETAHFKVRLGYLDRQGADGVQAAITSLNTPSA